MCALVFSAFIFLTLWGMAALTDQWPVLAIPLYSLAVLASLIICGGVVILGSFMDVLERSHERRLARMADDTNLRTKYRMAALRDLRRRQRHRAERERAAPVLPTIGGAITNGIAVFTWTVCFYIGAYSQLLRYWQVYFGGFTSGGDYWTWVRFCIPWLIDNSFWSIGQIFHWRISNIATTNTVTEALVWVFNTGLATVIIACLMLAMNAFLHNLVEYVLTTSNITSRRVVD